MKIGGWELCSGASRYDRCECRYLIDYEKESTKLKCSWESQLQYSILQKTKWSGCGHMTIKVTLIWKDELEVEGGDLIMEKMELRDETHRRTGESRNERHK